MRSEAIAIAAPTAVIFSIGFNKDAASTCRVTHLSLRFANAKNLITAHVDDNLTAGKVHTVFFDQGNGVTTKKMKLKLVQICSFTLEVGLSKEGAPIEPKILTPAKGQEFTSGHKYQLLVSLIDGSVTAGVCEIAKKVAQSNQASAGAVTATLAPPVMRNVLLMRTDSPEDIEVNGILSKSCVDAMRTIMENDKKSLSGVWYPGDLREFLMQNPSPDAPVDYFLGYADPEYFKRTDEYTFELIDGKSAAFAIESMLRGPSVLDCGNATQLAAYAGALAYLGKERFDEVFGSNEFKLVVSARGIIDPKSPLVNFATFTQASVSGAKGTIGNRPLKIGDECHFEGVKCYSLKHPAGFSKGWNVIYMGDNENGEQLFIAHGFERPMTEKEIIQMLLDGYNLERTPEDLAYIEKDKRPADFDKDRNLYLKLYYTIPTADPSLLKGYREMSPKRLMPAQLLLAKKDPFDKKARALILAHKKMTEAAIRAQLSMQRAHRN